MKLPISRIPLPLCGLALAIAGVSTLVAQNQPPDKAAAPPQSPPGEERVEVVIPDSGSIRQQLERILSQADRITPAEPQPSSLPSNPFAGKVVLLETASSLYPPYEDLSLESIGGQPFFVVEEPNGPASHEFWLAVDAVQSIRVFDERRSAEQFQRNARRGR